VREQIVLGVDPGFQVTGYAVVVRERGVTLVRDCGYLKFNVREHLSTRIGRFYRFFQQKITDYKVTHVSLETSFLGKNAQTFLKLGYLRGVLYLLADQHELALHEFAPREVKCAVTGVGSASKEQVAFMLQRLFPRVLQEAQKVRSDVTDALAIAMCGLFALQRSAVVIKSASGMVTERSVKNAV
jgi:crossover junction endodeoxyribonuclease RuvC